MDTFCTSHICVSAKKAEGAAALTEKEKARKYVHLDRAFLFKPVVAETCGSVGSDSLRLLCDLGRRLRSAAGEPQSFTYLLQWLSMAIQKGTPLL